MRKWNQKHLFLKNCIHNIKHFLIFRTSQRHKTDVRECPTCGCSSSLRGTASLCPPWPWEICTTWGLPPILAAPETNWNCCKYRKKLPITTKLQGKAHLPTHTTCPFTHLGSLLVGLLLNLQLNGEHFRLCTRLTRLSLCESCQLASLQDQLPWQRAQHQPVLLALLTHPCSWGSP